LIFYEITILSFENTRKIPDLGRLKYHFIFSIPDAFSSYQIVETWYSKIPVGNAVVSNTSYYLRCVYIGAISRAISH
jgi:hypothetical protein